MGDNSIRNLGYLEWSNNLASLEKQKGKKWSSLIREENKHFTNALSHVKPFTLENEPSKPRKLKGWSIEKSNPYQSWTHLKSGFTCKCWDADFSDSYFAAAVQDQDGFERFTLEIFKISDSKLRHLKTITSVGPTLAVQGGIVYYLKSEKDLRYSILESWSEEQSERLYTLEDERENLEIRRGEDRPYCLKGDFTRKSYAPIESKIRWSNDPPMESGIASENTKINGIKDTIESYSLKAEWAVSRNKGIRTLWNLSTSKPVTWIWGDISSDSREPFHLEISDIRYESYIIKLPKWVLSNPIPYPFPCSYYEHPLPAFVVHPDPTHTIIRGLFITTYGAYGTPTHVGSLINKWKLLLQRGWIVASVMIPGSGDHDKAWTVKGQRKNRLYAIEQFRDSIQALQEELGFPKEKTALYGRSAGGLIVTSVAVRYPELVGALYLESPYVDILRTITNPSLPLTTLETSEFGSLEDPVNILTTAEWSPMEHIPKKGIPGLFVVARTDLNDLEVFPYEVLKFIIRARGSSEKHNKLLFIHEGLGHFTTSNKSRGEDLALLDSWLNSSGMRKKNIDNKYKMPMTRKNRNRSRKNRDRKNRSRRNRNAMGGRRGSRKN
jgi:pimeloyl-ACP methyl ester carboxylesterase